MMTDATRFETRLTDALGRYADRMPVDVDAEWLVGVHASASTTRRVGRTRWVVAMVAVATITLAGLALFGGALQAPVPPVIVSPSPPGPTATSTTTPIPTSSATPVPTASPVPTPLAALQWTPQDIGSQPAVTSIWRVGEWFIAVGPESSFADDDPYVAARFIRSRDGKSWERVRVPTIGMQVETGTVVGDVLWVVGRTGLSADPRRGIWTTRDGATWERVKGVDGLDFGTGRVDSISHASPGWLASARRWIDAETQETLLFRSTDGVAWTAEAHGADLGSNLPLASDGERWLIVQDRAIATGSEIWALTSTNGADWTETRVAALARGSGAPASIDAGAVTFGPGGFVIVGQQLVGEHPHPVGWVSSDGVSWAAARLDGLPDPAGETGLRLIAPSEDGYLASGYRLDDAPSFWTSVDGSSWAQVDDLFGSDPVDVQALAVSGTTYVAAGQTSTGGAFMWSAPH